MLAAWLTRAPSHVFPLIWSLPVTMMHPWFSSVPLPTEPPHFPSIESLPLSPTWSRDPSYNPSLQERQQAIAIMRHLSLDLDHCELLQTYLEELSKVLDKMRFKIAETRERYGLIGYWTRQIPPEILSKIFCFCDESARPSLWAVRNLPLVCKSWSNVANATLSLWNSPIYLTKSMHPRESRPLPGLRIFFNPKLKQELSFSYQVITMNE
jgi:hypothetical protein